MSVRLDIKRFYKTLNTACRMRRWTQVPPFLKFTKFSILSQFVKHHWNIQISWAKPLHYYSIWLKKQMYTEMNNIPAWHWLLNLLVVWFTEMFAYLDMQTELWDCLFRWRKMIKAKFLVWFLFYGPSTHFRSFRVRSVNLATLFLGNPPRQFTST